MRKQPVYCACVSVKKLQPKLFKVAPAKWGDFEQNKFSIFGLVETVLVTMVKTIRQMADLPK